MPKPTKNRKQKNRDFPAQAGGTLLNRLASTPTHRLGPKKKKRAGVMKLSSVLFFPLSLYIGT